MAEERTFPIRVELPEKTGPHTLDKYLQNKDLEDLISIAELSGYTVDRDKRFLVSEQVPMPDIKVGKKMEEQEAGLAQWTSDGAVLTRGDETAYIVRVHYREMYYLVSENKQ